MSAIAIAQRVIQEPRCLMSGKGTINFRKPDDPTPFFLRDFSTGKVFASTDEEFMHCKSLLRITTPHSYIWTSLSYKVGERKSGAPHSHYFVPLTSLNLGYWNTDCPREAPVQHPLTHQVAQTFIIFGAFWTLHSPTLFQNSNNPATETRSD